MDPLEQIIAKALDGTDLAYVTDLGGGNPSNLDFRLTESGIEIEVKQFHTPRIAEQMSRAENVIAIQGKDAALFFANLLNAYGSVMKPICVFGDLTTETIDENGNYSVTHYRPNAQP